MKRSADDAFMDRSNRRILAEERLAACSAPCCAGCRKALTPHDAKSWHRVASACVDSETGVAKLEFEDTEVVCYFQGHRWRFCYCKECKARQVAIRGAKLIRQGGSTQCVSDSDNDSERREWEEEDEAIANLSEYQEILQAIWSTADKALHSEKYAHFRELFEHFMTESMRMKHKLPASSAGSSAGSSSETPLDFTVRKGPAYRAEDVKDGSDFCVFSACTRQCLKKAF